MSNPLQTRAFLKEKTNIFYLFVELYRVPALFEADFFIDNQKGLMYNNKKRK